MAGLPEPVLAVGLAATGVLLAGPLSAALARAGWPARAPRAALVLWQAMCLGAGLSLIGVGLVLAVAPLGPNLFEALVAGWQQLTAGEPFAGMRTWQVACAVVAVVCAALLVASLVRSAVVAGRRRRAHRAILDLLTSQPSGENAALVGVRVLDHKSAVAYTLPGWHSRVVLTAGMVELLTPQELSAVVEHERAHLRSRHDLLMLPFHAWSAALGFVPGVRQARQAVGELAEMLADDIATSGSANSDRATSHRATSDRATSDRATSRAEPRVLAAALAKVALDGIPDRPVPGAEGTPVAGGAVAARVRRLLEPRPLPVPAVAAVYLVAGLLVALPTIVLLIGWR